MSSRIVLSNQQLKEWHDANGFIQIVDSAGNELANVLKPPSPEVIATALERSQSEGIWHTTDELFRHLASLGD
jgi:hypothetical protein